KTLTEREVATLYGNFRGALVEYKDSLYGKGLLFEKNPEYLNSSLTEVDLSSDYTISFWIRAYNLSNTSNREGILVFKDATAPQTAESSQGLRFFLTGNTLEADITPGEVGNLRTSIQENKWTQIVLVYEAPNTVTLYKNGEVADAQNANMAYPNVERVFVSFR